MLDSVDELEDGWAPTTHWGEPAECLALADLDLLAEATHPVRGNILRRLRRPRTVAELAKLLDVPITRLYHHVNRLHDLELIHVVATRQVAAVTERRYQVVARSFSVDKELLKSTDKRELSVALSSLFDVARLGFERHIEAGGMDDLDRGDALSTLSLAETHLSPDRHRELIERLTELVKEFSSDVAEDDPDGTRVTLFVAAYEEPR
jgi:hypothetical protein